MLINFYLISIVYLSFNSKLFKLVLIYLIEVKILVTKNNNYL